MSTRALTAINLMPHSLAKSASILDENMKNQFKYVNGRWLDTWIEMYIDKICMIWLIDSDGITFFITLIKHLIMPLLLIQFQFETHTKKVQNSDNIDESNDGRWCQFVSQSLFLSFFLGWCFNWKLKHWARISFSHFGRTLMPQRWCILYNVIDAGNWKLSLHNLFFPTSHHARLFSSLEYSRVIRNHFWTMASYLSVYEKEKALLW